MKEKHVRLALIFKDFACWLMNTSSVGLNVAGYTTARVLQDLGVDVTVFPVRHNVDIVNRIDEYNETHHHPLTHVVISAPWMSRHDLKSLIQHFKDIQFVVLSHSNVGFLQADASGVELLREYKRLEEHYPNFRVGGNSRKFVNWFESAYGEKAICLPNLYPLDPPFRPLLKRRKWRGDRPLNIGAFGAVRPYKNFMTAAAAALVIQRATGVPVRFHMSAGGEGDGGMIAPAIEAMLEGTGVELIRHKWCYWTDFIRLIASMDLLIQPSYTESFNLITADGILMGVPSVVGPAISWAPDSWKADPDDAVDVAEVGLRLLNNDKIKEGVKALTESNNIGIVEWMKFLGLEKHSWFDDIKSFLGA